MKNAFNEDKFDIYYEWFTQECCDQYDELRWLMELAYKVEPENINTVLNDTCKWRKYK